MRIKCCEMINSQMLRSLVFTGVNPMNSIEFEEFGTNMTAGVINCYERNNWKFMRLAYGVVLQMPCWFVSNTDFKQPGGQSWKIRGKTSVMLISLFPLRRSKDLCLCQVE
ncbi:PREDICTED: uncharacterized protein LOC107332584 [Acropora digitifera]|uniref:uncharacterized protein LOC107332584 n=1 Tax=Acropora digitifera TaxID=70779 RepID=UPI00077AD73C|nr:PREDICTED: uncharacterized protein LOC107332584 [Acropora digitifera]